MDACITRRRASEVADEAEEAEGVIDLSDTEFVSRAAADEFIHRALTDDLQLRLSDDVEPMFDAVLAADDRELDSLLVG